MTTRSKILGAVFAALLSSCLVPGMALALYDGVGNDIRQGWSNSISNAGIVDGKFCEPKVDIYARTLVDGKTQTVHLEKDKDYEISGYYVDEDGDGRAEKKIGTPTTYMMCTVEISGKGEYTGTITKDIWVGSQSDFGTANMQVSCEGHYGFQKDGTFKAPELVVGIYDPVEGGYDMLEKDIDYVILGFESDPDEILPSPTKPKADAMVDYQFVIKGKGKYTGQCKSSVFKVDSKVHYWSKEVFDEVPTCYDGGSHYLYCSACSEELWETVPALGHAYVATWKWSADHKSAKATLTCKNDSSHVVEDLDATVSSTKTKAGLKMLARVYYEDKTYDNSVYVQDPQLKSIVSSNVKLASTKLAYTGKKLTPKITVTVGGKKLKKGTDYTLSLPSKRTNVGTYALTVRGIGDYAGTVGKKFKIVPKAVSGLKVTAGKKALTAKWKAAVKASATGYQVRYSTAKSMKGAKTLTVKKRTTKKLVIKKLKSKKKYYVQIRAYKTANKVKYYGAWSSIKSVKVK